MDLVADDDPLPVGELARYAGAGRAWVAVLPGDDDPVGYLLAGEVDGAGHVEQVSVHPAAGRRGVGRALVDRAAGWAADRGFGALTLTTYRHVPWNGPYYERLGFRFLTAGEEGPGLRAIRARERAHGLDRWPRACMRRDLPGSP
jgi:GNAT superfamily N-acetyltransferase